MPRPRTKTIPGYRVQPLLPMSFPYFGAVIEEADFTEYDGKPCVEASVRIGLIKNAYTLVLSIQQAVEADIIEVTDEPRRPEFIYADPDSPHNGHRIEMVAPGHTTWRCTRCNVLFKARRDQIIKQARSGR